MAGVSIRRDKAYRKYCKLRMSQVYMSFRQISFLAAARLKGFEHMPTFGPR